MSLLLPVLSTEIIEAMCLFTFHYVSITTVTANNYFKVNTDFTFHYVSITTQYTDDRNYNALLFFTFHYVSITTGDIREGPLDDMLFTFHYVSITTANANIVVTREASLHSTMSLLLPNTQRVHYRAEMSLHSTMSLLLLIQAAEIRLNWHLYIPLCLYYYPYLTITHITISILSLFVDLVIFFIDRI